MKVSSQFATMTVLASLLVGVGGGVAASLYTSTALDNYAAELLGDRGFTALEPRRPNVNPLDYEQAIRQVRDTESRSLAMIMPTSVDTAVPERWLTNDDQLGVGVVVSANGWILTTAAQLAAVANPVTGAEVWVRSTRYQVSELVEDDLTDYVLLKLTDATGLTPIGFGPSQDSRSGDMVFALNLTGGITAATLSETETATVDTPELAEEYATAWQLSERNGASGPVMSAGGDLLAFVDQDGLALPLHHGLSFVQEVIRGGEVMHARLGAYVVDLASLYNLDPAVRQGLNAGALILAPTGSVAVPINTPAAASGLRARDIVTAVEGEAVTPETSLAEILAAYDPGQTATFSLVREGSPIEVEVTFGE